MYDSSIYKKYEYTLEEKIESILNRLSFSPRLSGYKYLQTAIKIAVLEPETIYSLMKNIFCRVAKEYDTTVACVERAIRSAITDAWNKGDFEIQRKIFGSTVRFISGHPTDSEFIAVVAKTVSLETYL